MLSPLDQLYLRYDGAIPKAEMLAALRAQVKYIEQNSRKRPLPSFKIKPKPYVVVSHMVGIMIERFEACGACTKDDLYRAGCSDSMIAEHATEAATLAAKSIAARRLNATS